MVKNNNFFLTQNNYRAIKQLPFYLMHKEMPKNLNWFFPYYYILKINIPFLYNIKLDSFYFLKVEKYN